MDDITETIAEYAYTWNSPSVEALGTARLCLADALGCAIAALNYPACTKLLGPIVPETIVPHGCHIPGTNYILDPICGAFNLGSMIRWLDYNDTWLAAEWGHPSDNIGGILALMDHLSRKQLAFKTPSFTCKELLLSIIKAYEIQGILALTNSFNRIGFDHVILVKIATAAVATALMKGSRRQIADAISNAWVDVGSLRTYRHAPNVGSRKSWAAGDATSRGVQFAWMTMKGEMGYKTALTAPKWGFYDVLFKGKPLTLERPLGSYVMENILFKVAFPAEFHAQTALECAIALHPKVKEILHLIDFIEIHTQEAAIRIIDKKGPLNNPADRDHCLQYIVAIGLLHGTLNADHYEDSAAANPMIIQLCNKMKVLENPHYTSDYHKAEKRSIAAALKVHFKEGMQSEVIEIEYPLGHRFRRDEGIPLLFKKFKNNLSNHLNKSQIELLVQLFKKEFHFDSLPVSTLVDLFNPKDPIKGD
ncbi:MAG: bifunctional 2-methylcitrate dehydratase/aconitate hydratase [Parachlamydiaceae bacterium]|nr:bifunctional 2-methylcitrate dehydratase/aconitate hydratase [Parachlamydiaceae bacterium]